MNELFLYDREEGLFKAILQQSDKIEGRYHVSPDYGHDLNTNNLNSFIKDPKFGLTDAGQKYPICVCMTPKSAFSKINGVKWELFYFDLFFLCTAQTDGKNQLKKVDKATNTSGQHTWYDWSDMKACAGDFIELLDNIIRNKSVDGTRLRMVLNVEFDRATIKRATKIGNDKLNGVQLTFIVAMYSDACQLTDYPSTAFTDIEIPEKYFAYGQPAESNGEEDTTGDTDNNPPG